MQNDQKYMPWLSNMLLERYLRDYINRRTYFFLHLFAEDVISKYTVWKGSV